MSWLLQRFVWAAGGAIGGYLIGRYLTKELRAASMGDEWTGGPIPSRSDPTARAIYLQQQSAWASVRAREAVEELSAPDGFRALTPAESEAAHWLYERPTTLLKE